MKHREYYYWAESVVNLTLSGPVTHHDFPVDHLAGFAGRAHAHALQRNDRSCMQPMSPEPKRQIRNMIRR